MKLEKPNFLNTKENLHTDEIFWHGGSHILGFNIFKLPSFEVIPEGHFPSSVGLD